MSFDLFSGFSTLGLKEPTKPVKVTPSKEICFHAGEDESNYDSFLQVINSLAMMFKFTSPNSSSFASMYTNLDLTPEASVWDLITGGEGSKVNPADTSVLSEINDNFDWNAIKNEGDSGSYSDIANSGSLTDEEAFDLMCSMLDSRQRVFDGFESIFGPAGSLNDDTTVKANIDSFFDANSGVDSHNMIILGLFFNMQPGFINALNAYANCTTFWDKVHDYISTLSGDQQKQNAANHLESMWSNNIYRWDKWKDGSGNDVWAKDLAHTDNSWAKCYNDQMVVFNNTDAVRTVCGNIFNRSAQRKYQKDKVEYEEKKDEVRMEDLWLQKMAAKQRSVNKKFLKTLLGRKNKSVGRKSGAKKASPVAGHRAVAAKAKPPVVSAPAVKRAQNSAIAAGFAMRNAQAAAAAPRVSSVAAQAASQPVKAKKHEKDEKKVI